MFFGAGQHLRGERAKSLVWEPARWCLKSGLTRASDLRWPIEVGSITELTSLSE